MPKKDIYILGINTSHDRSACLLKNGKICVAIAEERLDRIKHSAVCDEKDNAFSLLPQRAIKYCLDCENIDINTIDLIVASCGLVYHPEMGYRNLTKNIVKNQLPLLKNPKKIVICNHHLSHAASAFWTSPFKKSAILIVDWAGNILKNKKIEHTSIFMGRNNKIKLIKKITSNESGHNSLGEMYTLATFFMGFGAFNEGKTMGLAPYGRNTYLTHYDRAVTYKGNGEYRVSPHFQIAEKGIISNRYKKLFGPPRTDNRAIRKVDKDIAFAVQRKLEDILINLCTYAYHQTNCENLCIAGGVGLNCTVNGKIINTTPFKNVFIQPAASDEGCTLGNALYGWHVLSKKSKRFIMKNAYLGRDYSKTEINQATEQWKGWVKSRQSRNIAKETARLIFKGKIIGWFQGGSETGPRALGHRSILADPRDPKMKARLNKNVKQRENFQPYAPSVLKEKTSEYFYLKGDSPFMLMAVGVKKPERIPAVVHVDNTARIQTVTKEENGVFYDVINEFYKLTGIPMVLNTSFNKRGKPIVETPQDALKCFLETQMDYLVLGDYIITKVKKGDSKKEKYPLLEKYLRHSDKIAILAKDKVRKFLYSPTSEGTLIWRLDHKILKSLADNEKIVFNLKKGTGYHLAEPELRIWNMADGTHKVRVIIHQARQGFDVDKKRASKDILGFIKEMVEEELFELSSIPEINADKKPYYTAST